MFLINPVSPGQPFLLSPCIIFPQHKFQPLHSNFQSFYLLFHSSKIIMPPTSSWTWSCQVELSLLWTTKPQKLHYSYPSFFPLTVKMKEVVCCDYYSKCALNSIPSSLLDKPNLFFFSPVFSPPHFLLAPSTYYLDWLQFPSAFKNKRTLKNKTKQSTTKKSSLTSPSLSNILSLPFPLLIL